MMEQVTQYVTLPNFLAAIIMIAAAYYVLPSLGEYLVGLARQNVCLVVLALAVAWLWISTPHVLHSLAVLGIMGVGIYVMFGSMFQQPARRRRRRRR